MSRSAAAQGMGRPRLTDGTLIHPTIFGAGTRSSALRAVDWNGDGLTDLVISFAFKKDDTIYLLLNQGTAASPRPLRCFGRPINITSHGPHPWAGDVDGDGRPDLVAYTEHSVYPFYCHAALELSDRPKLKLGAISSRR